MTVGVILLGAGLLIVLAADLWALRAYRCWLCGRPVWKRYYVRESRVICRKCFKKEF